MLLEKRKRIRIIDNGLLSNFHIIVSNTQRDPVFCQPKNLKDLSRLFFSRLQGFSSCGFLYTVLDWKIQTTHLKTLVF